MIWVLSSLKLENSDPPVINSDFRKFRQNARGGQALFSTQKRMGLDRRLRLGVGNGRRDLISKSGVIKDESPCSWYSQVKAPSNRCLVTRSRQEFSHPQESRGALQAQTIPVNRSPCADVGQLPKGPAWVGPRAQMPWTVTHQPRKNATQHRRTPLVYLNTDF